MDLAELQRHWNAFGEDDPLWAILTDPSRKGGRWTPAEFFATGVEEIAQVMATARGYGVPKRRRRALDFGCGVGRLTQALAGHCDEVLGLDVAPSMIAHARRFNRLEARVRYEVQAAPPLAHIASRSIDLVYTGRVLQHIAPRYARVYVAELARVLAPGGFLSFDLPSRWLDQARLPAGALPPGAYRAALDVAPLGVDDEGRRVFGVTVRNVGTDIWPTGTPLNVGNRWLASDGAVVVSDDQRQALALPLPPGAVAQVELRVPAPASPEAAVIEFDVVHEGVTWFAWQGSDVARVAVHGTRGPAPAPATQAPGGFEAVMEMHAVPRADVEGLLQDQGLRLLGVRPEFHCGPRWEAWRYDVTADGVD